MLTYADELYDGTLRAHFACFTSTRVQILTQKALQVPDPDELYDGKRMLTYADIC